MKLGWQSKGNFNLSLLAHLSHCGREGREGTAEPRQFLISAELISLLSDVLLSVTGADRPSDAGPTGSRGLIGLASCSAAKLDQVAGE